MFATAAADHHHAHALSPPPVREHRFDAWPDSGQVAVQDDRVHREHLAGVGRVGYRLHHVDRQLEDVREAHLEERVAADVRGSSGQVLVDHQNRVGALDLAPVFANQVVGALLFGPLEG